MNKHNFKALIFDLDGVIVDSEPLQFEAGQVLFDAYGVKIKIEDRVMDFVGKTDKEIISAVLKELGREELNVEKLTEERTKIYLELAKEKLLPVKGAIECVKEYSCNFKKLAITTSSNIEILDLVLDKFGIRNYFQALISANDIAYSKPHPDPYLKTIAKLECLPEECVVIEDTVVGIASAKAAGAKVIGVTTTYKREKLIEAGADQVFDNFDEITKYLI